MTDFKELYRESVKTRLQALEAAQQAFIHRDAEAGATIRRLAHSLRGSAGMYGYPEISSLAAAVEEAATETLLACLADLLQKMRDLAADVSKKPIGLLVVEDDVDIAAAISDKLSGPDRKVIAVSKVSQAEQLLAERHFALIILDLILPDQDGRVFLARLRERSRTSAIPVFVLTARSEELTRIECLAQGAEQFFTKPLDLTSLATAVLARLQRAGEIELETRRDYLTGLPNRAALCETFAVVRAHSLREDEPLSIAVLDLDHFKRVNDTYGHGLGDDVLRRAAGLIQDELRKSDLLARWGGEEFVALLPNTTSDGAFLAITKALKRLRSERFTGVDGTLFGITFSAGVSEVRDCLSASEAVNRADRFLYRAKAAGRNLVCGADNLTSTGGPCVLLVEDDLEIVRLIRDLLGQECCDLIHVDNGRDLLDAVARSPVALFIIDVNLPQQDGFTILEQLREAGVCSGVPTIFLTVLGDEKDILRGFELGADDYVVKPVSPAELLARIRRLLRKR